MRKIADRTQIASIAELSATPIECENTVLCAAVAPLADQPTVLRARPDAASLMQSSRTALYSPMLHHEPGSSLQPDLFTTHGLSAQPKPARRYLRLKVAATGLGFALGFSLQMVLLALLW